MKKCRNKKLYDFLMDRTNKSLIVLLLAFIVLMICSIFIQNVFLRIVFYIGFYMLINNLYMKIVNFFFAKDCK